MLCQHLQQWWETMQAGLGMENLLFYFKIVHTWTTFVIHFPSQSWNFIAHIMLARLVYVTGLNQTRFKKLHKNEVSWRSMRHLLPFTPTYLITVRKKWKQRTPSMPPWVPWKKSGIKIYCTALFLCISVIEDLAQSPAVTAPSQQFWIIYII